MAKAVWDVMDDADAALIHPDVLSASGEDGAQHPATAGYSKEVVRAAWGERYGRSPEPDKLYDMMIQLFLRKAVEVLGEEALPVYPMRAKTYFDSYTADNPRIVLTEEEAKSDYVMSYEERRERANEKWEQMSEEDRAPYFAKEREESERFVAECMELIARLHASR